jgi:rhamnosyltransferase subunit B
MRRILLTTIGSRGDLHPLLAVASTLQTRGYALMLALEASLAPVAREAGFLVTELPGDPAVLRPYAHQVYRGRPGVYSLAVSFRHYILPTLNAKVHQLLAVLRHMDLVIAPPVHPAAAIAAELAAVPWVSLSTTPAVPSGWIDPVAYPRWMPDTARRVLNRGLWALAGQCLCRITDPPVNSVRARWGLPPLNDVLSPASPRAVLNLVAVSETFVRRPPDWPPTLTLTGFCWWDAAARSGWSAVRPGRASPPVVAIVGGSTVEALGLEALPFFNEAIRAVHAAGARALVVGSPSSHLEAVRAGDVVRTGYTPFSEVFQSCDAVIHHGGIGTTAWALRAGIPALVGPWAFNQAFNAAQLARLGAGLHVPRRRFRGHTVGAALRRLLNDSGYLGVAQRIAQVLSREDGARVVADLIEGVWDAR